MHEIMIDSGVLVCCADHDHPDREIVEQAIRLIASQNVALVVTPQTLLDFWSVATRPVNQDGLGFSTAAALAAITAFEARFPVRHDNPRLLSTWRQVAAEHRVVGEEIRHAWTAAAMQAHRIERILAIDGIAFAPFPFVTVLTPANVLASNRARLLAS